MRREATEWDTRKMGGRGGGEIALCQTFKQAGSRHRKVWWGLGGMLNDKTTNGYGINILGGTFGARAIDSVEITQPSGPSLVS
jgi:hypothetical protein